MKQVAVTSWSAGWASNEVTLFNLEGTRCEKRRGREPDRTSGGLAQLGERLICIQEVNGSIPLFSTIEIRLKHSRD